MITRQCTHNSLGLLLLVATLVMQMSPNAHAQQLQENAERLALLAEIEAQVARTSAFLGSDRLDPQVADALLAVPRHAFIPPKLRSRAYANHPQPIGAGQTISQPYIVAIMSQLLDIEQGDRIYELGTGSGYQAAIIAEMGAEVYTVEIVPELAERARRTLQELGYHKVKVRTGDGWLGWPEAAPFDGIIVTAAAKEIPQPLIEQLAVGAHLVMPVGPAGRVQQLVVLTKQADGQLERREILPVRFVPVTGEHAR